MTLTRYRLADLTAKAYTEFMKRFTLILFILLCLAPLFGQQYGRGAILDSAQYEQVDLKPVLLSRSYDSLPRSFSLKQYSPIPESQGFYGTCVGWSTAFAARTISESFALGRTDRTLTNNNVFSPVHVYKNISDNEGQNGAYIPEALSFMRDSGIAKRIAEERTIEFPYISLSLYNTAQLYPIAGYTRLFINPRGTPGTISERVLPVKKALSEGKPVIIGMNCPDSFYDAIGVWQPWEDPYEDHGGHAMCVVGYDDNMYGGAFEIQNSWGTYWGNDGYMWIKYEDFALFVYHAYEMIENLAIYRSATQYAASIEIEVYNDNRGMPVTYDQQGFYRTRTSYPSETEFRFLMTNHSPAYVYAFSGDSATLNTERIFPLRGVSPVLDYTDSTVAWPGEHDWMILDDTIGTDYLVVLYSKEALDIDAIQRRFANERGSFPERVARAVGPNFIPYSEVQYNSNTIEFSAVSYNTKAVFGLLLAIDHR
jgi:hypothetical protein